MPRPNRVRRGRCWLGRKRLEHLSAEGVFEARDSSITRVITDERKVFRFQAKNMAAHSNLLTQHLGVRSRSSMAC